MPLLVSSTTNGTEAMTRTSLMKQEHLWIWISSKYAAGVHLLNEFVVCWICLFVSDPEHWTTLNVFEQFLQILNNPKRFKATMWTRTTYLSISTKHKNVQEFCYFGFRVIENRSTYHWNRRAAIPTKSAVVHMSTESVVGFCCIHSLDDMSDLLSIWWLNSSKI